MSSTFKISFQEYISDSIDNATKICFHITTRLLSWSANMFSNIVDSKISESIFFLLSNSKVSFICGVTSHFLLCCENMIRICKLEMHFTADYTKALSV